MEFQDFNELCQYVNLHTIEELLLPIYRYCLKENNYDGPMDTDTETMQSVLQDKYKYTFIPRLISEVSDIKQNLLQYQNLYLNFLSDDTSKDVLFHLLAYRLTLAKSQLYAAYCGDSHQYFDSRIVFYKNDCVFVDCGGLDGKNTVEFAIECPSYKRIYLYEPMKNYYMDCVENINKLKLKNVTIRNAAIYDTNTTLFFDASIKGNSKVSTKGLIEVDAVALDTDIIEPIGFIKMDIEGSEKQAISGAQGHIKHDAPILSICVYHLPDDIWQIANQVLSINPNYTLYLRHHRVDPCETVLYAVPLQETAILEDESNIMQLCKKFVAETSKYETNKLSDELLYLYYHLEKHKNALINSEQVVQELQSWVHQLEEAKIWLAQQYENYKVESERKDRVIDDLLKEKVK